MKQLYPIGTQFITKRLSQISLYVELFGDEYVTSCLGLTRGFSDEPVKDKGFYPDSEWWEVYDEENLKWLSPAPINGDLVLRGEQGSWVAMPLIWQKHNQPDGSEMIEKRTYPDGQREPLIVWDEVILPKKKG